MRRWRHLTLYSLFHASSVSAAVKATLLDTDMGGFMILNWFAAHRK